MAFARFLPKDILARSSGDRFLPLLDAAIFSRVSGECFLPRWEFAILRLPSSEIGPRFRFFALTDLDFVQFGGENRA